MWADRARKVAYLSMALGFSLILSYVETLFPVLPFPGAKLGIANLVTLLLLHRASVRDAAAVLFLRVLLSGILFTGMSGILYGLTGGALSFAVMAILKKTDRFSPVGVSLSGGAFHNVGQIFTAWILLGTSSVFSYLPVLILVGSVTGAVNGVIATLLLRRFPDSFSFQKQ